MKTYLVTVPIAGHITFDIEAENEQAAIDAAFRADVDAGDGDITWDMLEKFHSGNVCYCPTPWEAEAKEVES